MKKGILVLTMLLVGIAPIFGLAEDTPWFDMEKCVFCKNITAEPGLLEHMNTEIQNLDNGFLSITTVSPEYRDAYTRAQAAMQKTAESIVPGKELPYMCQFCSHYGGFMMNPAVKTQEVHTGAGDIIIMTSADSGTVNELQAFADRTTAEMAKLKTGEQTE